MPRETIAHLWKDSQHDNERAMHTLWQVARIENSDDYKHAIDLLNLYTIMVGNSSVVKTLHSPAAEEIIPKDRLHGMRVCRLSELTDRLYPTERYSQDELYESQTLFAVDILEQAWHGYNEYPTLPLRMATGLHNRFHSVSEKFKLEGYYKNHKRDLIKTVRLIERCGVRTLMDVYEHTGISMLGDLDSKQIDLMKHVINKDPQTLETLQNRPVTVVLGNTPLDDHIMVHSSMLIDSMVIVIHPQHYTLRLALWSMIYHTMLHFCESVASSPRLLFWQDMARQV